jgi:class 3 adenylate cyclase/tetratricopeptide (TPR) repeat protein
MAVPEGLCMHCPHCQHENREGARFCEACGGPLIPACPTCGHRPRPGAAFCDHCGAPLIGTPTAVTPPSLAPRLQTPQAYTPMHLAEKILTSRSALEGERKQVTVLFADLKGSMELLADRDPEEARQLLDPVLERMMDAVHRYEGTVNQVMGDGIMALFGAPIAHEDHAVRACYAALAMQMSVKQYAAQIQRTQGVPIHIRVGLNSGEVVVRSIGSDLHMDYSAIGQTTHLAARMEQMAMPGSILLTPEALRLVEGYVQVTSQGPVAVKGLRAPVEVYELVGAGPVRSRLQAAAVRGLTRFVGRARELDDLDQALQLAGSGYGQVVALVGEAGVGKSRLVYECLHSHYTQGWRVLEAASVSYGKATPYFPVIDLLKRYGHIENHDDTRIIRAKVTGQVLTLDEALQETIPGLLALLDALPEDHPFLQLEPPQRRQRTLAALKRLLLRESQVQPVLLVFEDLHWIDAETQALLDTLVDSLPTAHMLLLVNYRPEYQHGWGSKTYYTQLRLDPLPPASADELLQALLGDDPSLTPLTPLLIARTEGNPFFLEESVRTLVENGVLIGAPGAYHLGTPLNRLQVPATVQAVLTARIDRLPPEEKRLLQTAAVIGTDVPLPLLQTIADLPEAMLHRGLAHLQAAEFLYETRLFPEAEYTFKHALTHEVAYSSLLQERRRALHARIVEAIEALCADWMSEQIERLAHHALRGEVWEKALRYFRQAGAKAAMRSAHREAVACWEQALVALQHLPETRDTIEQAIDLRFDLRNSLWPLGEHGQIFAYLAQAEALAEALGDQRRLGTLYSFMTQQFRLMDDPGRAIESGQRALALATALEDFGLQVETNFRLGRAYDSLGDYRRAAEFFRQNVVSLESARIHEHFGLPGLASVLSCAWLGLCLAELGEFGEGIARGEEAVWIAQVVDHPYSLCTAYCGTGGLYLRKGDLPEAIRALERGLGLCRTWNFLVLLPTTASQLGYAYALSGQLPEAIALLEQVVIHSTYVEPMAYHSLFRLWLGEAYLLAGRMEDAIEFAGHALEPFRNQKERGSHQAWAFRLFGEIAAHRNPPDIETAEDSYRKALTLAEALGMRPLQAHCHHGLGTLYAKIDRCEPARAELSAAIDLYRSMGMTFWLPQAEAALARVEGR